MFLLLIIGDFKLTTNIELLAPLDRIIVSPIEVENKTLGGIVLTTNTSDPDNKARYGEVVATSDVDGKPLIPVGAKVYFGKHSGTTIIHNNEKYVSLNKIEIVAVVGG